MTLHLKKYFPSPLRRGVRVCGALYILFIYTVISVTSVIALYLQGFPR